jgi:hypothetical protein
MKSLKYIIICSLITMLIVSCNKGLDPIVEVAPGDDVSNPQLVITYPVDGKPFVSPDSLATITIKLTATDDIELKSVLLNLDGTDIGTITSFKDYRRAVINFDHANMVDGDHVLIVTVSDLTGKTTSQTVSFPKITAPAYTAMDGEVLYFSFDGFYLDLISGNSLTVVGAPGFASGKVIDAYAGATDAYMTYPTTGLLGDEFSLSFWYKINATPQRAGIFAIAPDGGTGTDEERKFGLRFFRENNGSNQNLGINLGIGTTDVWLNPFTTVPPDQDWMHIAISISTTHATVYVNDAIAKESDIAGKIDWTGCGTLSIASGEPNFTIWEHFSDLSLYDEMHIFKRAITAEEVHTLYSVKK